MENLFSVPQIRIFNNTIYQIRDLQSLQIISDLKNSVIAKVAIQVSSTSGNIIASIESEPIQIITGVQVYSGLNYRGMVNEIDLTNQVLHVNLRLIEASTGIIICMNDETVQLSGNAETSKIIKKNKKTKISKYITASGTVDLQGQYNNRKDTSFYIPNNFFRADIRNDIEIMGVPLSIRFYITTEQIHSAQKLNIYHVGFDVTKFKNNMLTKTKDKLEKIIQQKDSSINNFLIKLLDPALATQNLNSYKGNLRSKLEEISGDVLGKYQEQISAIDTLKQLFQTYDNASLYKLIDELKDMSKLAEDSLIKIAENKLDSTVSKMDSAKLNRFQNEQQTVNMTTVKNPTQIKQVLNTDQLKSEGIDKSSQYIMQGKEKVLSMMDSTKRIKIQKILKVLEKYKILNHTQVIQLIEKVKKFSLQDLTKLTVLKQHLSANTTDLQNKVNVDLKQIVTKPDFTSLLNKEDILEKLDDKFSILSKKDKILNSIKGLDIGYTTPVIGRNTQNGIAINGYNLEFNYKKFIIASNGGKLLNNLPYNSSSLRSFKQFIFSNSIGYGSRSSNYILLTHTFGKLIQSDSLPVIKNHIVSLNYNIALLKKKLFISGELPFSLIKKSGSMMYGYAPSIQTKYAITKSTQLHAMYEYISRDYTTFGTPFIILDYHHTEAQLEQTIKSKYIIGTGYSFKRFKDSLNSNNYILLHSVPVSLNARITKEIHVNCVFTANWLLENKFSETMQQNFFYTINAAINYNKQFKKLGYSMQTACINSYFLNNDRAVSENGPVILTTDVHTLYKNISCYTFHSFQINRNINTSFSINYSYYNNIVQDNKNFIIFTLQYQHSFGKKFILMLSNTMNKNLQTSFRNSTSVNLTYRINRYIMLMTRFQYDKLKGWESAEWHNDNGYLLNSGIRLTY